MRKRGGFGSPTTALEHLSAYPLSYWMTCHAGVENFPARMSVESYGAIACLLVLLKRKVRIRRQRALDGNALNP